MASPAKRTRPDEASVGTGMVMGAIGGFAIWMSTGSFVFFPVFIGLGFVLGIVAKEADDRREGS